MKFFWLVAIVSITVSSALDGLYYQIYSDAFAYQEMQNQMSCVTAIFDQTQSKRGYYMFSGYRKEEQTISKYRGVLLPRDQNCYTMRPSTVHVQNSTNAEQQICLFSVQGNRNYLVATNGALKRTFILSRLQPDPHFPSLHDLEFLSINDTIFDYQLPMNLVRTNHSGCFFYPPKDIDYILKKTSGP